MCGLACPTVAHFCPKSLVCPSSTNVAVLIQFINNGLMESWSTFAIISISVSLFIGVDALYRQFVKVCIFGISFGSPESYGVDANDISRAAKRTRHDPDWIVERRNMRLSQVERENVFAGCCSAQSEMGFVPAAQLNQLSPREQRRSDAKRNKQRAASQKKAVRNIAYENPVYNSRKSNLTPSMPDRKASDVQTN